VDIHPDTDTDTLTRPDPLDQLVPPPRPWWLRLAVALVVVGLVGTGSYLVGHGYLYPRPDCCGSGSGSAMMARSPDGKSVLVSSFFYNSSDATLVVRGAKVQLPGAHVVSVGVSIERDGAIDLLDMGALPGIIGAHVRARVVVAFVPDSCVDASAQWGTVDLRLDVRNGWLPSFERTYRVPGAVVDTNQGISVLPPNDDPNWSSLRTPLAVACALLAATP
jgi:hypothetical protein